MKSSPKYINEENFLSFLYNEEPHLNFLNNDLIKKIKALYFEYESNPLPVYKASAVLRNVLSSIGRLSKTKVYTKEYWTALGYSDDSEIRTKIYSYYKNMNLGIDLYFDNDMDKFKKGIKDLLVEFNFNNTEYLECLHKYSFSEEICLPQQHLYRKIHKYISDNYGKISTVLKKEYWLARGFDEKYAIDKISESQRIRSKRCKEYYISRGYAEDIAQYMVSDEQRKYSLCGKGKTKYWTDLGFDIDTAKSLAKEYSRKSSVRCVEYWMSLGYSETDAISKTKEYNPSDISFINYDNDINKYTEKICRSRLQGINNWKNADTRNKMIYSFKRGKLQTISKAEVQMFDFLINNVNKNIQHTPYIVVIPDNCCITTKNSYFYVCDGYLELKNGIIIIEFDGVLYHNDEQDKHRDDDILYLDNSIVGILRIKQDFLKRSISINNKIKLVQDALQKIENSTETRIVI